jgi:predicted ferric reductase
VIDINIVNRKVSGFVSLAMIQKSLGEIKDKDYFICGPPAMTNILKKSLSEAGISPDAVHAEEFSLL